MTKALGNSLDFCKNPAPRLLFFLSSNEGTRLKPARCQRRSNRSAHPPSAYDLISVLWVWLLLFCLVVCVSFWCDRSKKPPTNQPLAWFMPTPYRQCHLSLCLHITASSELPPFHATRFSNCFCKLNGKAYMKIFIVLIMGNS